MPRPYERVSRDRDDSAEHLALRLAALLDIELGPRFLDQRLQIPGGQWLGPGSQADDSIAYRKSSKEH